MSYAGGMPGKRPPSEPEGEKKVISIVEELERRQMARVRDRASAMHLRELESSLDLIDHTAALKEMDLDEELAKLDKLAPEDRRRQRANVRAARALQSCLRGDPEAGFAEWAEVIAEAPELAHPYLVRARWLIQSDPTAAIADYDRAAQAEPSNPTVYVRRGDCHVVLNDFDRALANYRRALTLDPSLIDVHLAVGKILANRGEHAQAIHAYDRAIHLAPRYADFYLCRAQSHDKLGEYDAALKDYGRILELDPSRNDVRFYRVLALHHAGRSAKAIEEMAKLLELEPDDHHNHRVLGKIHVELGQYEQAVAALTRAVELGPDDPLAHAHLGRAHWETGQKEASLADFTRAVELRPGEAEFHLGLAKSYASLDRMPEALASADRGVELAPDHSFGRIMRAVYRTYVEGDACFPVVMADLDHAVSLAPRNPAYRRQRGEYLMEYGYMAAALLDFEHALARAPESGSLYFDRGYCKSRLDEELWDADEEHYEEDEDTQIRCRSAVADFEKAVALGCKYEDLYTEMWNAYSQMGETEQAGRALDRGCEALPRSATLFFWRYNHRKSRGDAEGAAADRARAAENGWEWRPDE